MRISVDGTLYEVTWTGAMATEWAKSQVITNPEKPSRLEARVARSEASNLREVVRRRTQRGWKPCAIAAWCGITPREVESILRKRKVQA